MPEAPVQQPLQVEAKPIGKVEQAKVKAKELSGRIKKLLNRLKVDAEDKPRKVLKEIEESSKIDDPLLLNEETIVIKTKPKKSVDSVVQSSLETKVKNKVGGSKVDSHDSNEKPNELQEKITDRKALEILATPPPQISEANEKKDIPVSDNLVAKKQPLVDRLIRKTMTPERTTEFLSGQIMMGLEIAHDMDLYPAKYGLRPDQVGSLPNPNTNPAAAWAVDHIGDIWEISAGFTAMRLGFVAANEVLKKIPAARGYQIPDEACFWASLATTVTVKAVHSLGYISLFGIHDHMANPVPGMLFGQGVAAVVLAASHYAAKYREPIKDLALRGAKFTGRKFKEFDQKMNALGRSDVAPDVVANVNEQVKK